jgi:hypothetical protein
MEICFKRSRPRLVRGRSPARFVVLMLLFGIQQAHADSVPSLEGTWKLTNDDDNRTLVFHQTGRDIKGEGLWADGTRSFVVEGDFSQAGVLNLKFFLDRSDALGDKTMTDALWDQAVKSRADAAHPGMLPIQRSVSLDYVAHDGSLIGRRPLAKIKHENDKFTEIVETTATVRLVRTGILQGTLPGVRDDVAP